MNDQLKYAIARFGTQEELAEQMNVSQQAVSKWLTNRIPHRRQLQLDKLMRQHMSNDETFIQLEAAVIDWALKKGILDNGTKEGQANKTVEEAKELLHAVIADDTAEIMDAIGDVCVTIIIQAKMNGWTVSECLKKAYDVISRRTGRMVDGVFVKD